VVSCTLDGSQIPNRGAQAIATAQKVFIVYEGLLRQSVEYRHRNGYITCS